MEAELYHPLFLAAVCILCVFYIFKFSTTPDFRFQIEKTGYIIPLILCVILAFWLGQRPVSSVFGDTFNYAFSYELDGEIERETPEGWNTEWFWHFLITTCHFFDLDVHTFFTIVEFGYVLSAFWAVKRFVPTNPMVGMLFIVSSLMFYTFGVNGIRNGLACHLVFLAISYFFDERLLPAVTLSILAIGTHLSVVLPLGSYFLCRYFLLDYKNAVAVWLVALVLSATIGSQLTKFALLFSIDDRYTNYLTGEGMDEYKMGFRVDFILYSLPPILLGWYVIIKKGINDGWYTTLCSMYCVCNAFWLLVIRAAYTNRFAYLSWFLYPVLIAYPLINLPVWRDQDKRISLSLLAYLGFTLFMEIVVWKTV
ncbi:MAG: EpsG family protein [Muribaculaceae bacterium]|nr:EpsG family protein [Muribaculaceae bacterium]